MQKSVTKTSNGTTVSTTATDDDVPAESAFVSVRDGRNTSKFARKFYAFLLESFGKNETASIEEMGLTTSEPTIDPTSVPHKDV